MILLVILSNSTSFTIVSASSSQEDMANLKKGKYDDSTTNQAALVPAASLLPTRHCQLLPQHTFLQLPLQGHTHQVFRHSFKVTVSQAWKKPRIS